MKKSIQLGFVNVDNPFNRKEISTFPSIFSSTNDRESAHRLFTPSKVSRGGVVWSDIQTRSEKSVRGVWSLRKTAGSRKRSPGSPYLLCHPGNVAELVSRASISIPSDSGGAVPSLTDVNAARDQRCTPADLKINARADCWATISLIAATE